MPADPITVDGVAGAVDMLRAVGTRAANPYRSLESIVTDFREEMTHEFSSQGVTGGRRWKRLDRDTLDKKSAEGLSTVVLEATSRLRESLVRRGGESIEERDEKGVTLGTSVPYAHFHQSGTAQMPARPIKVHSKTIRRWVDRITDEIMGGAE